MLEKVISAAILLSVVGLCSSVALKSPFSMQCKEYVEPKVPFTLVNNKYYFHTATKMSWWVAHEFCLFNNMQLVQLKTKADNDAFQAASTKAGIKINLWTSGNSLGEDNKFVWAINGYPFYYTKWGNDTAPIPGMTADSLLVWRANGNAFSYTNWQTGAPSKDEHVVLGRPNCVEFAYASAASKWNNDYCVHEKSFACETKEPEQPAGSHLCILK